MEGNAEVATQGRARWMALIAEQQGSGDSVAEFCARRGLAKPTFYEWRRRLQPAPRRRSGSAFVAVHVRRPVTATGSGVEVVLREGRRLRLERGFDREVLLAAVEALEARAC